MEPYSAIEAPVSFANGNLTLLFYILSPILSMRNKFNSPSWTSGRSEVV